MCQWFLEELITFLKQTVGNAPYLPQKRNARGITSTRPLQIGRAMVSHAQFVSAIGWGLLY